MYLHAFAAQSTTFQSRRVWSCRHHCFATKITGRYVLLAAWAGEEGRQGISLLFLIHSLIACLVLLAAIPEAFKVC